MKHRDDTDVQYAVGSIRQVENILFTSFLNIFLRKGREKRKVSTHTRYVPGLCNLLN